MLSRQWTVYDYLNYLSYPKELLVLFFYLGIIGLLSFNFKRNVKPNFLKKYVYPAISLKIIGSISITSIFLFYYEHGDTTAYYNDACLLVDLFFSDTNLWLEIFFNNYDDYSLRALEFSKTLRFKGGSGSFLVAKVGSIFCFFTLKTFYAISLFFAWFSFVGLWKLYLTLVSIFPIFYKELAYSLFFIPSVFFWGSGLMKEPLIIFALGYFINAFIYLFIKNKYKIKYLFYLSISAYIIATIKIYIIASLFPALLGYFLFHHKKSIRNPTIRRIVIPFLLLLCIIIGNVFLKSIGSINATYSSVENLTKTIQITGEYIRWVSDKSGGSSYDLGVIDYSSFYGWLAIMPKAINVSFFRPYIWETNNLVMLLSAFESFIFSLLFIWIIVKIGLIKSTKIIFKEPFILFCFIFSFVFAFAVGFTSFNFGALVRYKIPMLPFFSFLLLFIIRHKKSLIEKK